MTLVLVDTNILVYAHDVGDGEKRDRAVKALDRLNELSCGRLSVQCLAEFFAAMRRGSRPRLTEEEAADQIERLARAWPVIELTPMIVLEAIRGVRLHRLSYWDAQIWATARLNQIPVVFSEDFQDGRSLEGVTFVNPVADKFEPANWG